MAGKVLMQTSRVRRLVVLLYPLYLGVSGCHDPRYVEQREIRRQRIEHQLTKYDEHAAAGPQRIQETLDLHEKLRQQHKESLERTCALCKKLHERDVQRWRSERDIRRERCRTYLQGKPDQIDDTWAKMMY